MTRVACLYCGLPFKVRRVEPDHEYFCCTGCAMLARVPVDPQGHFPVNAHLISVLAVSFLYFNQLLFWLLSAVLGHDTAQALLAQRFGGLTAAMAFVVWLAVVIVQRSERSVRAGDLVVAAVALAAHGVSLRVFSHTAPCWMAATNALLLLWSSRGLLRLKRR
jgi:hypothetical protein